MDLLLLCIMEWWQTGIFQKVNKVIFVVHVLLYILLYTHKVLWRYSYPDSFILKYSYHFIDPEVSP